MYLGITLVWLFLVNLVEIVSSSRICQEDFTYGPQCQEKVKDGLMYKYNEGIARITIPYTIPVAYIDNFPSRFNPLKMLVTPNPTIFGSKSYSSFKFRMLNSSYPLVKTLNTFLIDVNDSSIRSFIEIPLGVKLLSDSRTVYIKIREGSEEFDDDDPDWWVDDYLLNDSSKDSQMNVIIFTIASLACSVSILTFYCCCVLCTFLAFIRSKQFSYHKLYNNNNNNNNNKSKRKNPSSERLSKDNEDDDMLPLLSSTSDHTYESDLESSSSERQVHNEHFVNDDEEDEDHNNMDLTEPRIIFKQHFRQINFKELKFLKRINHQHGASYIVEIYKSSWKSKIVASKVFHLRRYRKLMKKKQIKEQQQQTETNRLKRYTRSTTVPIIPEFEQELSISVGLNHPNIVKLFGWTFEYPYLALIFEFCEHSDLRSYFYEHIFGYDHHQNSSSEARVNYNDNNRKKIENKNKNNITTTIQQRKKRKCFRFFKKIKILYETSLALDYLHELGIIHRDVKCDNILLDSDFNAKVCDFGVSKVYKKGQKTENDQKSSYLQQYNELVFGTSNYLAPEILRGYDFDHKIDVFSFAIVMYEILYENFDPYDSYFEKRPQIGDCGKEKREEEEEEKKKNMCMEYRVANDDNFRPYLYLEQTEQQQSIQNNENENYDYDENDDDDDMNDFFFNETEKEEEEERKKVVIHSTQKNRQQQKQKRPFWNLRKERRGKVTETDIRLIDLMVSCWNGNPLERPSMGIISSILLQLMEEEEKIFQKSIHQKKKMRKKKEDDSDDLDVDILDDDVNIVVTDNTEGVKSKKSEIEVVELV